MELRIESANEEEFLRLARNLNYHSYLITED